ncbi:Retinol dehydrogenase 13 [Cytospora mali]|uniref:Retinol dehydrogenase 13 n=1 Tax=Cytospora mali TaxID=578113 RepID=A0A194VM99_CYTMA|nr:Retinol dehydrogenase 13 [Valsa mali]
MAPTFDITPEKQASQLHFMKSQLTESKPHALTRKDADLNGQTAIVTGVGNVGVGLETARQLLNLGLSKLILGVRNEERGHDASRILLEGRTSGQTVEVWELDLAEYTSVTTFAERVAALDARPDIVVLNAGVLRVNPTINPSTGHDEDIQTNFLSTVLLLILLLRTIKTKPSAAATPPVPHVSIVSTVNAHWTKFLERDTDPLLPAFDVKNPPNWDMQERYGASKLLVLLFLSELVKKVPDTLAIINAPTPGMCHGSRLARDAAGTMLGLIFGIYMRLVGNSCPVGARTVTFAAVKAGPESQGQYLENGKLRPLPVIMYTPDGERVAQKVWKETLQELSFAGVEQIIQELTAT